MSRTNGTVAWQWVTVDESRRSDPRFTVVPCRDGPFRGGAGVDVGTLIASACGCKTVYWFRRALHLYPHARFIAKAEDDSGLHDGRIVTELAHAWHARPGMPMWYGYFQWAGLNPASRRNGWYCGEGDNLLKTLEPRCPQPRQGKFAGNDPNAVPLRVDADDHAATRRNEHIAARWGTEASESSAVGPFASGGLDIRSRRLAQMVAEAGFDVHFAREWTEPDPVLGGHGGCEDGVASCGALDWAGACDGLQGYLIARTLRKAIQQNVNASSSAGHLTAAFARNVTALHLTTRKFHYPPTTSATSVMHAGELKGAQKFTAPPNWTYNTGLAVLPLAMRLVPTAQGIGWRPEAQSGVDAFLDPVASSMGCQPDGTGVPCMAIPNEHELALHQVHARLAESESRSVMSDETGQ